MIGQEPRAGGQTTKGRRRGGELELTSFLPFASLPSLSPQSAHLDHAGGLAYIMEKVSSLPHVTLARQVGRTGGRARPELSSVSLAG